MKRATIEQQKRKPLKAIPLKRLKVFIKLVRSTKPLDDYIRDFDSYLQSYKRALQRGSGYSGGPSESQNDWSARCRDHYAALESKFNYLCDLLIGAELLTDKQRTNFTFRVVDGESSSFRPGKVNGDEFISYLRALKAKAEKRKL